MPLNIRSIAVSMAVVSFFGISFIAWLSGLSPFTCCKRALTGALLSYLAVVLAVKAVNAIIISAMVEKQMERHKESKGAGEN